MSETNTVQGRQPSTTEVVLSKVILSILPIAQIVIGAVFHNDCPKQHYIPIYLEVMGGYYLLVIGYSFLDNKFKPSGTTLSYLSVLFLLSWFITGNVWIYSIYEPNYNKTITDVDPYCNKTVYLFAFWITNLSYIQFGLLICCGCYFPNQLPLKMLMLK